MDYPHPDLHAPIALSVTVAATRRRQVRRSARPREYLTEREIEKASDMGTSGGGHSTISTCPQSPLRVRRVRTGHCSGTIPCRRNYSGSRQLKRIGTVRSISSPFSSVGGGAKGCPLRMVSSAALSSEGYPEDRTMRFETSSPLRLRLKKT